MPPLGQVEALGYGVSTEFGFGVLWADWSFKKVEREREGHGLREKQ